MSAVRWMLDPQVWLSLLTLTCLEIVLGIDNIIFISILAGKLPASKRARARTIGLSLALITRVLLLCSVYWLIGLSAPLFHLFERPISLKDLVLIAGGLFLMGKSTIEIQERLEEDHPAKGPTHAPLTLPSAVVQIVLLDIVFSIDSVVTAVGIGRNLPVMIAAVTIALVLMLFCAGAIGNFVNRRPTIRMLAVSFMLLIGFVLVADGLGEHIARGYIYFAMAFSLGVEMLNTKARGSPHTNVQGKL
jgi:predicted tellurium resistance membrane protein TerC